MIAPDGAKELFSAPGAIAPGALNHFCPRSSASKGHLGVFRTLGGLMRCTFVVRWPFTVNLCRAVFWLLGDDAMDV